MSDGLPFGPRMEALEEGRELLRWRCCIVFENIRAVDTSMGSAVEERLVAGR